MTDDASGPGVPGPAVRLICAVEGDGVRVLSRRRLTKVVPPSEPIDDQEAGRAGQWSGFWIEVRDDRDRVRYRRVVADPLAGEVEVPGGDGSFTRRESARASAAFALLVPDLPDADHVSLVRGGAAPAATARAFALAARTGEVARLSLREEAPAGDAAPDPPGRDPREGR